MIPSWFVYGDKDKNIPPQAFAFMAARAHAKQAVGIPANPDGGMRREGDELELYDEVESALDGVLQVSIAFRDWATQGDRQTTI
jgi:hypothetical protein